MKIASKAPRPPRVPVFSLATGLCALRRGLPESLLHDDALQSFDLQRELRDAFGFDSAPFYLHATYGTFEHAAGLGFASSELQAEPTLPFYPVPDTIENEAELAAFRLPDVRHAGMLPVAMRFSELQAQRGLPVSVVLGGVFTVAANLCGMERLFTWTLEKPRLVQRLLSIAVDHLLEVARLWATSFGAARVTPAIWEGIASQRLLSRAHFESFVLPAQQRLNAGLLELGMPRLLCHACGAQEALLDLWARIPLGAGGIFSLGHEVSLAAASAHFAQAVLMGNVDPRLLSDATPEHVHEAAIRCVEVGARHPGGFVLAPGCALDRAVPDANLRALVAAARPG